ncbi:MAG: acyl--CoA ligase [Rhizobiaceae bacterium]|nr:acyl--CoA ligase [Rhizobiaceae bacterium]
MNIHSAADLRHESYEKLRKAVEAAGIAPDLGTLLDTAVARYADQPAWVHVEQDLPDISWSQLGARVARAANALCGLGAGKGSHVGVMLPNVPDSLISWLAIARLGARMIPINPGYTPREMNYWLTDGDVDTLIIDVTRFAVYDAVAAEAPLLKKERVITWGDGSVAGFRRFDELVANAAVQFTPPVSIDTDDIVNIQYTSGSTGLPKGCLLSHRYWIQCGAVMNAAWPSLKRIQCDLPFHYMGPLWRFAMAAHSGAALCVPPSYSLSRFRERLRSGRYDMSWMTNPVAMLDPRPDESDHELTMIATFGMTPKLQTSIAQRYGVPVRDAFGMTEIGFGSAVLLSDDSVMGTGSCGKPLPWREMMIADEKGNALGDNELGELCVAGPGMLQGYHKKPEATNAAFRGKWFRTGDLARRDERGYYFIVGRVKEMIRRSAENISVTEVEGALSLHPDVQSVAVHGVKDALRGEEVKACIILRPQLDPTKCDPMVFIGFARENLAKFKVPRYVQLYGGFPMTPSNKISRKRLQEGEGETLSQTYDAQEGVWIDDPATTEGVAP